MKITFFKNRNRNAVSKDGAPLLNNKANLQLMKNIETVHRLHLKGLITYSTKEGRVAIADSVYAMFCHKEKTLNNFMKNVLMWLNFEESNRAGLRLPAEQRRDPNIQCKVNIPGMEVVVVSTTKMETLVIGRFENDKFVIKG